MDVLTSRKVKEEPGTRRASNRLIGAGEYRENVGILEGAEQVDLVYGETASVPGSGRQRHGRDRGFD